MIITDVMERDLSELGFLPLCHCHDTEYSAFYTNESIQKPKRYSDPTATKNARISKMLQHMFCSSRFAHYLKVIARDQMGGFSTAKELQDYLHNWLVNYVNPDPGAKRETRARFPLLAADVEVRNKRGDAGAFEAKFRLEPLHDLDDLHVSMSVRTSLSPKK